MELEIGNIIVEGRLGKSKFEESFKAFFNLDRAIRDSIEIVKNENKYSLDEICSFLSAEINWGYVFSLGLDKDIQFRICELAVKDMVQYKKEGINASYTNITLKESKLNGVFNIVVHNYIRNPEHFFDEWIQNNCYDYVHSKYSELNLEGQEFSQNYKFEGNKLSDIINAKIQSGIKEMEEATKQSIKLPKNSPFYFGG